MARVIASLSGDLRQTTGAANAWPSTRALLCWPHHSSRGRCGQNTVAWRLAAAPGSPRLISALSSRFSRLQRLPRRYNRIGADSPHSKKQKERRCGCRVGIPIAGCRVRCQRVAAMIACKRLREAFTDPDDIARKASGPGQHQFLEMLLHPVALTRGSALRQ